MAKFEFDNTDFISAEEAPDPDTLPKVNGWNVLIRPVPVKNTIGNSRKLIMPEKTRDDIHYLNNVGRVLALGSLAYADKEKFGPEPWCKVGDFVTIPRFVGEKVVYKGIKMLLVEDINVKLVLDSPEDIDPTKNIEQ